MGKKKANKAATAAAEASPKVAQQRSDEKTEDLNSSVVAAAPVENDLPEEAPAEEDAAAASPAAAARQSKNAARRAAAWVDEDEDALTGPAAARAAAAPAWAAQALESARTAKRGRGAAGGERDPLVDGVQAVLARAEATVHRPGDSAVLAAPKPESTLLQQKGGVKDVAWHPSGEVLIVGTASSLETVHCAGRFTDRIAVHKLEKSRMSTFAVSPNGESVVTLVQHAHVPLEIHLRTGKVKPLHFLDTRSSTAYKVATAGKRIDEFPSLIAFKPRDAARRAFAMPVGSHVLLGSMADAVVTQKLVVGTPVEDVVYMGDHQLAVAAGPRVMIYDARNAAKFVRAFTDEGALTVNRLAYHAGVLSVGSTSGTVNTYLGEATKPAKTFMNLTASVDLLVAGEASAGPALIMGSSQQKNGFRFVNTASMTVAPSFPDVAMRHGLVKCLAFNPAQSIFTVGEGNRIVNYAC